MNVMGRDGRGNFEATQSYKHPLTPANLPPAHTTRWTARRKAELVAAVHGALLTLPQACARYGITLEEFRGWELALHKHGLPGLRSTCVQQYRRPPDEQGREGLVPAQDR
jgi:hypothetical protein